MSTAAELIAYLSTPDSPDVDMQDMALTAAANGDLEKAIISPSTYPHAETAQTVVQATNNQIIEGNKNFVSEVIQNSNIPADEKIKNMGLILGAHVASNPTDAKILQMQLQEVYHPTTYNNYVKNAMTVGDAATGLEKDNNAGIVNLEKAKIFNKYALLTKSIESAGQTVGGDLGGKVGAVWDMFTLGMNPASLMQVSYVLKKTFDEHGIPYKEDLFDKVSPARLIESLKTTLASTPPEKAKAIMDTAGKYLIENAKSDPTASGFSMASNLSLIFGDDFTGQEGKAFGVIPESYLTNTFAVLNLLGLGPLATTASKITQGIYRGVFPVSTMAKMAAHAPVLAGNAARAVEASGTARAVEMSGATPAEITTQYAMPKPEGVPLKAGPDLSPEAVESSIRKPSDIPLFMVTPEIRSQALTNFNEAVQNQLGSIHPSKTVVTLTSEAKALEDVLEYKTVFALDQDHGFPDMADVQLSIFNGKTAFPEAQFSVLTRDQMGNLIPVDISMLPENTRWDKIKGDFYVQMSGKKYFNLLDYPDLHKEFVGSPGWVSQWFGEQQFNREHQLFRNGFVNEASRAIGKLVEDQQIIRNLSYADRRLLDSYYKEMQSVKDSAPIRLQNNWGFFRDQLGFSKGAYEGMLAIDRLNTNYLKAVREGWYTKLFATGHKGVDFQGKTIIATPMKSVPNVSKLLVADKNFGDKVINMSSELRKTIESGKARVWKLYNSEEDGLIGNTQYDYILVDHADQIKTLPLDIGREIPKYLKRVSDAGFYVGRASKVYKNGAANAEISNQWVGAAYTEEAAKKWISLQKGDSQYIIKQARDLWPANHAGQTLHDMSDNLLNQITRADKPLVLIGDVDLTFDFAKSLGMQQNLATTSLSRLKSVYAKVNAWERVYKEKYGSFKFGSYLARPENVGEEFKLADTLHNHINLENGSLPRQEQRLWGEWAHNMGDSLLIGSKYISKGLGRKTVQGLASSIKSSRGWQDISDPARSLASVISVAWKPIEQLSYAVTTVPYMAAHPYAFKYMMGGGMYRELIKMVASGMKSSILGELSENATLAYRQYTKTGLSGVVDQHVLLQGMGNEALNVIRGPMEALKAPGNVAVNTVKGLTAAARYAGFTTGEIYQRMSAFLIARNQYLKETSKLAERLTDDELFKIAAQAEIVNFNMNSAGRLGTTEGALGAVMQFLTMTLKVGTYMLPRSETMKFVIPVLDVDVLKLGSQNLSNTQKAALATGVFFTFGLGGFGQNIQTLMRKTEEQVGALPDDFKIFFGNGMSAWMLHHASPNSLINTSDLAPSKGITDLLVAPIVAPATFFYDLIIDGMTAEDSFKDMLGKIGPTAGVTAVGNVYDALKGAVGVMFGDPGDMFEGRDKAVALFRQFYPIISDLNTYEKAYAAITTGEILNKHRDPIAQATLLEGLFRLTGARSGKETGAYEIIQTISGKYLGESSGGGRINHQQNLAKSHAEVIMQGFKMGDRHNTDMIHFQEQVIPRIAMVRGGMNREEDKEYRNALTKELAALLTKDSLTDRYVAKVITAYQHRTLGGKDNLLDIINSFAPSELRDKLIAYFKMSMPPQGIINTKD